MIIEIGWGGVTEWLHDNSLAVESSQPVSATPPQSPPPRRLFCRFKILKICSLKILLLALFAALPWRAWKCNNSSLKLLTLCHSYHRVGSTPQIQSSRKHCFQHFPSSTALKEDGGLRDYKSQNGPLHGNKKVC
jgi:hypothetical protein